MAGAWACRLTPENIPAIISEHPRFDQQEFDAWIAKYGEGYFIRDASSPLDCQYMLEFVLLQMYAFKHNDVDALFRSIVKL